MILSYSEHELKTKIGCNLIHNNFIEEILIINYKYKRRNGVDYTSLLTNNFLLKAYKTDNRIDVNINSLLPKDKLITVTYSTLDKLDVLLLMDIKDVIFKDILFKSKENNSYYFEIIY